MSHASLLTALATPGSYSSDDRSALGVDAPHGTRDPDLATAHDVVPPRTYTDARPDLETASALTVDEVLTFVALRRATSLALARCRAHLPGGIVDVASALILVASIESDPTLDPVLDERADALLAAADALLEQVPSEPSDAVAESERLAAALDELDDEEIGAEAMREAA